MRLASWDLRASALIRFSRSLRSWSALAVSEHDRKYGEELAGLQSTRQVKTKPHMIPHLPVQRETMCSKMNQQVKTN